MATNLRGSIALSAFSGDGQFFDPNRLYSPGTVAYRLGVPDRTIRYYCEIARIEAFKLGKVWRIPGWAVRKYLESCKNGPWEPPNPAVTAATASF